MIKVSIIIPTYNVGKYLDQCLKTVVSQTLKEIEIIIIDNQSIDDTLAIANSFSERDKRIIILTKPKNTGYGNSINLGLSKAAGKYIGIVEADDFIEKEMFLTLYNLAEKNKCEIVKSNFFLHKNGLDIKQNLFLSSEVNKTINPKENQHFLTKHACIWSAIYRRDFLIKNKIKCLDLLNHSFQDISFNFKALLLANKVYLTSAAYYHYRLSPTQSIRSKKYSTAPIKEFREISKFMPAKVLRKSAAAFTANKFYSYKWNIERLTIRSGLLFAKLAKQDFVKDQSESMFYTSLLNEYGRSDLDFLIAHPYLYVIKTKISAIRRKEI